MDNLIERTIDCGFVVISNSGNNYGYEQGTIPINITDWKIVGYSLTCGSIFASNGLQYHLMFANDTRWFINYYRPYSMQDSRVNIALSITVRKYL